MSGFSDRLIESALQASAQVRQEPRRERFEAWAAGNGISIVRTPQALGFANGQRRAAGDYIMVESLCAWAAWNEALDGVVVELPQQSGANLDWNQAIRYCGEAIEAAGLKVAP